MGVVNTTPDSFSDGGDNYDPKVAVRSALDMLDRGADIVDVGGESTRPGSEPVPVEEEMRRVVPVIEAICSRRPDAVVSVDTRRSAVAEQAIRAGAQIVNDVAGFRDDPQLMDICRDAGVACVIMHMLGRPKTMQQEICYRDFPHDVYEFLAGRMQALEDRGMDPARIIIDPGIGFGKTFDQNLVLINRLDMFRKLGKPILVGASRKAFIGAILQCDKPKERENGSVGAAVAAVMRGADIVRVHDVARSIEAFRVADAVRRERVAS
jgi:dihydropteroate synthase